MSPFFSIGIPTYNRKELLQESLASIRSQTFTNFEVVISNDYPEEKLSLSELGIDGDPRFRLINQEKNIGPIKNHQFTMDVSEGQYFTWLSDDDLMASTFLESVYAALESCPAAACVFSSFDSGTAYSRKEEAEKQQGAVEKLSGRAFLREYLSGKVKVIGNYGVFASEYIARLGGLENLGTGARSPYSDNLLAIKAGSLEKVLYIDSPLLFFRVHEGSPSHSSVSVDSFISAQQDLLSRCEDIFLDPALSDDYHQNMYQLLAWCSRDLYAVLYRGHLFLPRTFVSHLKTLEKYARATGWNYLKFISLNIGLMGKYLIKRMSRKKGNGDVVGS